MAAAIDTNAEHIKPLLNRGCVTVRGTFGATVTAGQPVTLQSDGYWDPTDTSGVQLIVGVAVKAGSAGETEDIVLFGPMHLMTGATPGTLIYASDTAGGISESAGTKGLVIGYAESATILVVMPQIISFS